MKNRFLRASFLCDKEHHLGLCEAECLLFPFLHLSPLWQTEFVSPAQYITEIHPSAHTQALSSLSVFVFLFFLIRNTAEVDVKVPSVGRMLHTAYCAECPSGISPHYSAMRAKNANRKEVHFCCYIITFLFFSPSVLLLVITALRLAKVCGLKCAVMKSK